MDIKLEDLSKAELLHLVRNKMVFVSAADLWLAKYQVSSDAAMKCLDDACKLDEKAHKDDSLTARIDRSKQQVKLIKQHHRYARSAEKFWKFMKEAKTARRDS